MFPTHNFRRRCLFIVCSFLPTLFPLLLWLKCQQGKGEIDRCVRHRRQRSAGFRYWESQCSKRERGSELIDSTPLHLCRPFRLVADDRRLCLLKNAAVDTSCSIAAVNAVIFIRSLESEIRGILFSLISSTFSILPSVKRTRTRTLLSPPLIHPPPSRADATKFVISGFEFSRQSYAFGIAAYLGGGGAGVGRGNTRNPRRRGRRRFNI